MKYIRAVQVGTYIVKTLNICSDCLDKQCKPRSARSLRTDLIGVHTGTSVPFRLHILEEPQ